MKTICITESYVAPSVEIIEVAVEKGFATSDYESQTLSGSAEDAEVNWW